MPATTVIITGASKGFGRAIARAFARLTDGDVHFVISGRNHSDLESLQSELAILREQSSFQTTCDVVTADLSNISDISDTANRLFATSKNWTERSVNFVNNAGSLGQLCSVGWQAQNSNSFVDAVSLNVTSSLLLTSEFVRRYEHHCKELTAAAPGKATVVNVSSIAGILPIPNWSVYCATRAGREMFHKVLAEEQKKKRTVGTQEALHEIRVLSYAPGPMETDMQREIRAAEASDPSMGNWSTDMHAKGAYVDVNTSAEKLVRLLRTPGAFESGAHVDFYDANEGLL
jgi:sepiapterin reductase